MRFRSILLSLVALALIQGCDHGGEPESPPESVSIPDEIQSDAPVTSAPQATAEASANSDEIVSDGRTEPRAEIPIRFNIFPRRTQFLLGEPVEIFVQHTNLWDEQVAVRCNYFLDQGFEIWITDSDGEAFRFIDEIHGGIPLPNYARIPAGESRGFYELLIHSEVDNRGPIFTEPGIYRIDAQVHAQIDALGDEVLLLRAPPITVEIIEPFTPEDQAVYEILLWPEVTQALQSMSAPPELENPMQTVLETAPNSVYAEHAHFVLAGILMEREEWLAANEHLYEVYSNPDGFYPKDMVLISIVSCFDHANEPERAIAVCRILQELFPDVGSRNIPLINSYIELSESIASE